MIVTSIDGTASTSRRANSSPLAVETIGLVKRFPKQSGWRNLVTPDSDKVVLAGVDLAVQRGETFGLLGPNGAGKTTLVKILSTLITPTAGAARVAGYDVIRQDVEVRKRIGLIYGDERSFFWRLTLQENLRFYAAIYGIRGAAAQHRIDELTELVGLGDAKQVRMHHFSSGMKQRAAIARGLLGDPEVVFLDEPTSSVDPIGAHAIRAMIRERIVAGGQRTVILTTNLMDEAEALCDRLALLTHSRIGLVGAVDDLRRQLHPDERYVIVVSDVDERVVTGLQRLPDIRGVSARRLDGGALEVALLVRSGHPAVPNAIRLLVNASGSIWSCRHDELSLDEIFRMVFDERPASALPTPRPHATAGATR